MSDYSHLVTVDWSAGLVAAKDYRTAAEVVVADTAAPGVATVSVEALVSLAAHMAEVAVETKCPDVATAQGRCTAHPPFHRIASRRADEQRA